MTERDMSMERIHPDDLLAADRWLARTLEARDQLGRVHT